MKLLGSITNHAFVAGKFSTVTVTSNQAQATVTQIGAPAVDKMVYSDGTGQRTTAAFSTVSAGEVLIALDASDGPSTGFRRDRR
jgi:hypothetical protein